MNYELRPKNWELVLNEERSNQFQAGKKTRRYDIREADSGLLIATIWGEDEFIKSMQKTPTQEQQDYNARLIMAAPRLLKVCQAVKDICIDDRL